MKYLIMVFFACYIGKTNAQTFKPDSTIETEYVDQPSYKLDSVIQTKLSKNQLYGSAISYVSNGLRDGKISFEHKDPAAGEVFFNGYSSMSISAITHERITLFFKGKIYVKDGRFRVVLSHFEYPFRGDDLSSIKFQLRMPGGSVGDRDSDRNGRVLARSIYNDVINKLDKKPNSDF